RKLMPTYEERLVWCTGDGHGLKTFPVKNFTMGALNCWENWMPLARTSLYGQGENLHIALWPGSVRNTEDLTRFIARESRSFVVSVSGLMNKENIPENIPFSKELKEKMPEVSADGGSCVAGPDGKWVLEPVVGKEGLFITEIDIKSVFKERNNFDPTGHYSRPDVLQLQLNSKRLGSIDEFNAV
ncbi:MAG: carbon-nitrogen hydrolase family protein, partial [Cyclobacteriaceae bacterium]|nr:carbon-nitrogen hydrolase family protein [Cyclobacteriaceae bacterium]